MHLIDSSVLQPNYLRQDAPVSLYQCYQTQTILNVPICNPLLILVLQGKKQLGRSDRTLFESGDFAFLSNRGTIDMRNIPNDVEYMALIVEFEAEDFHSLPKSDANNQTFIKGKASDLLIKTIEQFIIWASTAPRSLWHLRRKELLQVLHSEGYNYLSQMVMRSRAQQVRDILSSDLTKDFSCAKVAMLLAVSESTLRRQLVAEQVSFKILKHQVRMSHALHLLQSSTKAIGEVVYECGYSSASRFTEQFKRQFNMTPSQLRKTRLNERG